MLLHYVNFRSLLCVYDSYAYITNKSAYSLATTIQYTPLLLIASEQTYCELFIGLLVINIPGKLPFWSWKHKYEFPLTTHATPGLTSQVSSIGTTVTPGWYMTTPGCSIVVVPTCLWRRYRIYVATYKYVPGSAKINHLCTKIADLFCLCSIIT